MPRTTSTVRLRRIFKIHHRLRTMQPFSAEELAFSCQEVDPNANARLIRGDIGLLRELGEVPPHPATLVDAGADTPWLPRLAAYWSARDRFIDTGRTVRPSADVRQMLVQVQAPLLALLQTSPDFRPAFDPLKRMARQLANSDPVAAQSLLDALAAIEARRAPIGASDTAPLRQDAAPKDGTQAPRLDPVKRSGGK